MFGRPARSYQTPATAMKKKTAPQCRPFSAFTLRADRGATSPLAAFGDLPDVSPAGGVLAGRWIGGPS
jgi:hypothetical protein